MQIISPEKVIRGRNAWKRSLPEIVKISKSPLILGRSGLTRPLRSIISNDLAQLNLRVCESELQFDCCEEDLKRIYNLAIKHKCDSIITAGGGKVLDAGKIIAEYLRVPCITVPLSASTCAGWTALGNIYTTDGKFIKE